MVNSQSLVKLNAAMTPKMSVDMLLSGIANDMFTLLRKYYKYQVPGAVDVGCSLNGEFKTGATNLEILKG